MGKSRERGESSLFPFTRERETEREWVYWEAYLGGPAQKLGGREGLWVKGAGGEEEAMGLKVTRSLPLFRLFLFVGGYCYRAMLVEDWPGRVAY